MILPRTPVRRLSVQIPEATISARRAGKNPRRFGLRARLKTTRDAAARDFGRGQGGEVGASPQRAVTTEPTRVTGKRPADRRVFSKRPSGFVAPQSKIHEGYSPSSRLAIRPFAGKQPPRVVFKQALSLALAFLFAVSAQAEVKLPPIFSDHAVLQQGVLVPVWGTAAAGEKVTVSLNGQSQTAMAGADGKWIVRLTGLQAGGPFEMTVAGQNTLTIKDVLVGEVWLGSGQSNMQFPVSSKRAAYAGLANEADEIAAANYPQIRMFTGRPTKSYEPQSSIAGEWRICSPETVPDFSAMGYLFARDLQKELHTPVGILTLAFGASTAEAWISRDVMAADPQMKPLLDALDACEKFYKENPQGSTNQAPPHPKTINARPGRGGSRGDPAQDQHFPTVLFNGMINPVIPYAIRGVIWYQGESIVGGTPGVNLYGHVQQALIKDWRQRWGEGDFPFYIVQLPGQKNVSNNPRIREEQATLLALPNTGMAVTIDTGEATNVHPKNKEPVGDRLTRLALAQVYGRKIEYYGPMYDSMKTEGSAIRITFTHIGGGLVAKGGPLKGFQIAGADQKFVAANARIDGEFLVVSSPEVSAPVAVRYAWDNFPEGMGCNLFNAADLPAAPFRTDRWEYHLDVVEN